MADKPFNISNESVKNATGKGWDEWIKILDKANARDMSHKDTARFVYDKYLSKGMPSDKNAGWWSQMVTVGYEYSRGKRVIGETLSTGFEIGVQKTLPIAQEKLWKLINSPRGKKIWAKDAEVEIRTQKDLERLRMRYTPKGRKEPTTLQIYLTCPRNTKEKTSLQFHQEKLASATERAKMKKHWQGVIEELAKLT